MAHILKKEHTRLRVKAFSAPMSATPILGSGIDIINMPDGHLSCSKCENPYFETWVYPLASQIECGCTNCSWSVKLIFPIDIDLSGLGSSRWTCQKHKKGENVIIKNADVLCIGCRDCASERRISLKTKSNLVLAT